MGLFSDILRAFVDSCEAETTFERRHAQAFGIEREADETRSAVVEFIDSVDVSDCVFDDSRKKRADDIFKLARANPYPDVKAAAIRKLRELQEDCTFSKAADYIFEMAVAVSALGRND